MKKRLLIIVITVLVMIGLGTAYYLLNRGDPQQKATPQPVAQEPPSTVPHVSQVDQIMSAMTLSDKVASLFIFHLPTTDSSVMTSYVSTHKPSGLIFMGDNIPNTLDQLRAQTAALTTVQQLPLLTSVDEEGATVKRLAADTFPGAPTLREQPPEATKDAFSMRSDLLRSVGLNLNFGIIADVTADPHSFIYPRVLGTTPAAASDRVAQAVEGSKGKVLSTIKHFPGHGETGGDSHKSVPTTETSYSDWQARVSPPFSAGIEAGTDMVMFGHLRYSSVDEQPATLSKKWHDIIRNELNFKGIIITDDMIMLQNSGESAFSDPVGNAVAALAAGNDLLLYVLDHMDPKSKIDPATLINGVVTAINDGRIDSASIDERVKNILELRYQLGVH